jgi:hypothetical protein
LNGREVVRTSDVVGRLSVTLSALDNTLSGTARVTMASASDKLTGHLFHLEVARRTGIRADPLALVLNVVRRRRGERRIHDVGGVEDRGVDANV